MNDNIVTERALADAYLTRYPGEVAVALERADPEEAVHLLESISDDRAAALITRMGVESAIENLSRMSGERMSAIIRALDPARAAVLVGSLDEPERERTLGSLDERTAAGLRELMDYPPGTAGRLMRTRILVFDTDSTVRQALAKIRRGRIGVRNLVLVDGEGRLAGLVPLSDLVVADDNAPLATLVRGDPPFVLAMAPREEVTEILARHDVTTLPVVDVEMRVLGVLSYDALLHSVKEEATADLQTMVGVSKQERALSTPWFAVRKRLPWLNINLLTAFVAAAVVGLFEDTIARFTALAILLPVVAGQSGNAGAQALAVTMRGLALREIQFRHALRVIGKESLAGLLNGVAIAVVTALGVLIWSQSAGLALVIALAMVLSMTLAGVAGAGIPLLLTRANQDPAQSGSIILTTVTDVVGFLSFLGLATLMARML